MNKAFLSNASCPTIFMANYLLDLSGSDTNQHLLIKNAKLKSELGAYKQEYFKVKSENESLLQRYEALVRQTMRNSQSAIVQQPQQQQIRPMVPGNFHQSRAVSGKPRAVYQQQQMRPMIPESSQRTNFHQYRLPSSETPIEPQSCSGAFNKDTTKTSSVEQQLSKQTDSPVIILEDLKFNISLSESSSEEEVESEPKEVEPQEEQKLPEANKEPETPTIEEELNLELENNFSGLIAQLIDASETAFQQPDDAQVPENIQSLPQLGPEVHVTVAVTREMPELQPAPSSFDVDLLATPVVTFNVADAFTKIVNETIEDENSDYSEDLMIDERDPKGEQTLISAASKEIDEAVKSLEQSNLPSLTVEDSLRSLFGLQEEPQIEGSIEPEVVDDVVELLAAGPRSQTPEVESSSEEFEKTLVQENSDIVAAGTAIKSIFDDDSDEVSGLEIGKSSTLSLSSDSSLSTQESVGKREEKETCDDKLSVDEKLADVLQVN